MPKVIKQTAHAKKPNTGSVLDEAIPIEELEDEFIKLVIYGQNRTGKTWLACQFPKPLLLVSFEPNKTGGAKTVAKVPGITLMRIKTMEKALRLAQELKDGEMEWNGITFKTVVLDSATSYQDIILQDILDLPEVPEQLNWGMVSRDQYRQRSEQTKEALRPFLNMDCHTVITAKERDHNPPDKEKPEMLRGFQLESYIASDLGGQTVGWLHDACDYICRLYLAKEVLTETKEVPIPGKAGKTRTLTTSRETGKIVRRLRTLYSPNYAAGFRTSTPSVIPEYIESPTFELIKMLIDGKPIPNGKPKG